MGISQSELSFGMMLFCLPNKKHMVKTTGKAEFAAIWNIKSKEYCDIDK
jgi:hypothetical protein